MRAITWLWILLLIGCDFSNLRPTEKLKQSIQEMNEAARWGRIDLAAQFVGPAYRQRFFRAHSTWGQRIQIADLEVVRLDIDSKKKSATASIAISWYGLDQMTLRQTTVRQQWKLLDGQYILDDEDVLEGEPALLAIPVNKTSSSSPLM
jgi:hypothetical protein